MISRTSSTVALGLIGMLASACSPPLSQASSCTVESQDDGALIVCDDGSSALIANGTDGSSCTAIDNGDGTRTINCADGSSVTVSDGQDGVDGQDGAAGTSCTVADNGDGTKTIACTDGTSVVVSDGVAGANGEGCTVADNEDGTKTISCADGSHVMVSDGATGAAGTSCTVVDNGDSTHTIGCEDGTSVTLVDGAAGQDGAAGSNCTVVDNVDGSKLISCDDGSSATIYDGSTGAAGASCTVSYDGELGAATIRCEDGSAATVSDGTGCSVTDNTDGSKTMSCPDGTSVTWKGVAQPCTITFDEAWAAGAWDVNDFYGAFGLGMTGGGSLIGGDLYDDPGNWDVPNPAWGMWTGSPYQLTVPVATDALSVQFLQSHWDTTLELTAYLDDVVVATRTVHLTGAYHVETVDFTGTKVNKITWSGSPQAPMAVDNIQYESFNACP